MLPRRGLALQNAPQPSGREKIPRVDWWEVDDLAATYWGENILQMMSDNVLLSMISNETELATLLSRVMQQYRNNSEFFATHELPEYRAIESLNFDNRELALFLTFGSVTNHIRLH